MNLQLKWKEFISFLRRYADFLRMVELVALAIALLSIFVVGYLSLYMLQEHNSHREQLSKESKDLSAELDQLRNQRENVVKVGLNTRTALSNLEQFNNRFLKDAVQGRLIMINELNKLIKKNNLALQGGLTFDYFYSGDTEKGKGRRRRTEGQQEEVYPGVRTSFGVNGTYNNFRQFLHDLETNDLFIVIQGLDFQTAQAQEGNVRGSQMINRAAPANSDSVSVQLDIKIYFRNQNHGTNQ
ncbi:MAG: hypothetical protein AB1489_04205 [Acidobacteriota bacterium]